MQLGTVDLLWGRAYSRHVRILSGWFLLSRRTVSGSGVSPTADRICKQTFKSTTLYYFLLLLLHLGA